jgi:hypothetical protein
MIFMVSSRDRNCQRIEMTREVIARAPPPAFLFPNQQCQRPRTKAPNHLAAAHPFSARCRRRRLSIQPRIPCQTVFFKTVRTNPPETAKTNSSRPKRPSKEQRQSSQSRIPKKLSDDPVSNLGNSCEPHPVTPRRVASSETAPPCQPWISLNFRSNPKPSTSPNFRILIELFPSARSGASIEASTPCQSPRFLIFREAEAATKRQKEIRGPPRPPTWIRYRVEWSAQTNEADRRKQGPCVPCRVVVIAFPSEGRI